ncbi:MAG: hypothetical protein ACK4MX_06445, partial [Thermaurantiacus sp.]
AIGDLLGCGGGARIGQVFVETGPGSFTGLRVGLAAARALALAWSAELRGIPSASLIAAEAGKRGATTPLLVALAAPRGQVWLVEPGTSAAPGPARSLWPDAARAIADAWIDSGGEVTGSGAPALVGARAGPERAPRADAAALLPLSALVPPRALYVSAERGAAGGLVSV